MIDVELEGVEEVNELLASMPNAHYESAKEAFKESVFNVHRDVTNRIRLGPLHSRTGQLARSMRTEVKGATILSLSGRVYTDSIYAPIHEVGGTINAKRAYRGLAGGPYLNIPSEANTTPAGVQRMDATSVFGAGGYIIPLATSPRAKYAVMLNGVPMFWLVKNVKIPPRLGMRDTVDDEIPTLLSNLSKVLDAEYEG